MTFDEGVEELVQVLPALPASDMLSVRRGGGAATWTEPAPTPVEGNGSGAARASDEHLGELGMQIAAEGHLARDASERPASSE